MAKRQPNDYIKRRDVIRAMHEKHPSWGDSNYNFIRDIPSADVYTRDEVIAMLTEIQLEIEEIEIDEPFGFEPVSKTAAFYDGVSASSRVIQQKINALKADRSEEV